MGIISIISLIDLYTKSYLLIGIFIFIYTYLLIETISIILDILEKLLQFFFKSNNFGSNQNNFNNNQNSDNNDHPEDNDKKKKALTKTLESHAFNENNEEGWRKRDIAGIIIGGSLVIAAFVYFGGPQMVTDAYHYFIGGKPKGGDGSGLGAGSEEIKDAVNKVADIANSIKDTVSDTSSNISDTSSNTSNTSVNHFAGGRSLQLPYDMNIAMGQVVPAAFTIIVSAITSYYDNSSASLELDPIFADWTNDLTTAAAYELFLKFSLNPYLNMNDEIELFKNRIGDTNIDLSDYQISKLKYFLESYVELLKSMHKQIDYSLEDYNELNEGNKIAMIFLMDSLKDGLNDTIEPFLALLKENDGNDSDHDSNHIIRDLFKEAINQTMHQKYTVYISTLGDEGRKVLVNDLANQCCDFIKNQIASEVQIIDNLRTISVLTEDEQNSIIVKVVEYANSFDDEMSE